MTDYTPDGYFPQGYFPPDYFGGDAGGVIVGVLVGTANGTSTVSGTLTNGHVPAGFVDTNDGLYKERRARRKREKDDRDKLRAELIAKYEGVRETPQADATGDVATAVAAYAPVKAPDLPAAPQIDWDRLSRDLAAVASILAASLEAERLKREAQEREDEEGAAMALLM